MEYIIIAVIGFAVIFLIGLLIKFFKLLPKIFYYIFLWPSISIGYLASKLLSVIHFQLIVSIGFVLLPYFFGVVYSLLSDEIIIISEYPFSAFKLFLTANIIAHIISLRRQINICEVKYCKPSINLYYKYLYASVFLFVVSNVLFYLSYVFRNSNFLFFSSFLLCIIFFMISVSMFIYTFVKKIQYLIFINKYISILQENKSINATDVFAITPEYLDEADIECFHHDLYLLVVIGMIRKMISKQKIINITVTNNLWLFNKKYYDEKYLHLDNTLSGETLNKAILIKYIQDEFEFNSEEAKFYSEKYLDLKKYNFNESDETTKENPKKGEVMGILGSIINTAKKGYASYKDAIKKEKEKMENWPDKRLAFFAQKRTMLPAGMAATQILKERGYSSSQIVNM